MHEEQEIIRTEKREAFHVFRDFMYHFIPLVLVTVVIVASVIAAQKYLRTDRIKMRGRSIIKQGKGVIQETLVARAIDALFLANMYRTGCPLCPDEKLRRSLFQISLESLSRARRVYAQIRFLNTSGQEVIRVKRAEGHTWSVKMDEMQDKSSRPYFEEGMNASSEEVVVSPFNLNMEYGKIEKPLKPAIRFAVPVETFKGERKGIVVLNYLGSNLIRRLHQLVSIPGEGEIYLANDQGYWLIAPDPSMAWGFVLGNTTTGHIGYAYPKLWECIQKDDHGQVVLDNTLFTFQKLTPTYEGNPENGGYPRTKVLESWVVISSIPLHKMGYEFVLFGGVLGVIAFIGLGVVSWFWTEARHRERLGQLQLEYSARRDGLTGLFNRADFVRQMEDEIERAKRYGRSLSLVFFDIDHFKAINDTYGHDRGDEVLCVLSEVVQTTCREQDIAGRMGGEEFAVLLPETDRKQAATMAERLRQAVEELEVRLDEENVVRFTISIGVTSMAKDEQTETFKTLYTRVDALMFQAKAAGRNRVIVG